VISLFSSLSDLPSLLSCFTCMGNSDDPAVHAANMAILFMLALLVPVLGGLVGLIFHFGRREKRFAALEATNASSSTPDSP